MTYKVTIEKITSKDVLKREDWGVIKEHFLKEEDYMLLPDNEKLDWRWSLNSNCYIKQTMGYRKEYVEQKVDASSIYEQTITELDIRAVINAVNSPTSVPCGTIVKIPNLERN